MYALDLRHNRTVGGIALTMVLTIALYWISVSEQFKPTPDSCEYIGLARSIWNGQGYAFNGRQGSFYPPMLSLISVVPIHIAHQLGRPGLAVILLKFIQTIVAFGLAYGAWRLARRYVSPLAAAMAGLAVLTNICVFQHCIYIVSDILFASLTIGALLLLDDRREWKGWLAGTVLLALACLTRSVGMVTIIAVLLALVFGKWIQLNPIDRLKRFILIALIAPAPYIFWKLTYAIASDSYLSRWEKLTGKTGLFAVIWERFTSQLSVVPLRSTQILLNIEQITLPLYFAAIVFALLVLGWAVRFIRYRALPEWFALCYIAVMCIWFDQGPRFYLPVLPLLLIYAVTAVNWLNQQITKEGILSHCLLWIFLGGAVGLAIPLFQHIAADRTPAPMEFLRNGYLHSLAAAIFGIAMIVSLFIASRKHQPIVIMNDRMKKAGVVLYLSLGWLYFAGFAALEHGWVGTRPPMLAGYDGYFQMGQWLRQQPDVVEPVLCANASIVHLAGGTVTDEPAWRNLDDVRNKLEMGDYGDLLVLESTSPVSTEDQQNQIIQRLIHESPKQFRQIGAAEQKNTGRYGLYRYQAENALSVNERDNY